jgi:putative ABC transport system permease protein
MLSIAGLSLATAAAVVLLLYVRYEKSYDNFRDDSVYRVTYHGFQHDQETGQAAQIIPALAPAIKNEIPEIELAVRFAHTGPFMADPVMQYGNKYFRESRIYFADKDFVSLFSYELISGSTAKALAEPNQVIISKSMQQKYFGNADALGKIITFHQGDPGTKDLIVTGVFEDVPSNSHFHTDFVVSFATLGFNLDQDWDWGNFYTYIKIREGVDSEIVQGKIPATLDKYVGKMMAELTSEGYRIEFQLQPIHLTISSSTITTTHNTRPMISSEKYSWCFRLWRFSLPALGSLA